MEIFFCILQVFAAWRDVAALLSYERAMENEKLSEIKKGMDKGKDSHLTHFNMPVHDENLYSDNEGIFML